MRKLFCKNDAADFEDLPAFNEEKVSLTMIVAGIWCGGCRGSAAITATIVCLLRRNKD